MLSVESHSYLSLLTRFDRLVRIGNGNATTIRCSTVENKLVVPNILESEDCCLQTIALRKGTDTRLCGIKLYLSFLLLALRESNCRSNKQEYK